MCYGTCSFKTERDGECDGWLLHNSEKIKEVTGYKICFIGGADIHCKEQEDYYNKLVKDGTIKRCKMTIDKILEDSLKGFRRE